MPEPYTVEMLFDYMQAWLDKVYGPDEWLGCELQIGPTCHACGTPHMRVVVPKRRATPP